MKIRAAVTRAPHAPMSLETLEIEAPRADEVLIRISASGVCHTDIAMRSKASACRTGIRNEFPRYRYSPCRELRGLTTQLRLQELARCFYRSSEQTPG
jgi:hypothetical protein